MTVSDLIARGKVFTAWRKKGKEEEVKKGTEREREEESEKGGRRERLSKRRNH